MNVTGAGGGTVVVLHNDARSDNQHYYYSIYTHVHPKVEVGTKVLRGDVIANIADISPPHLHFEMREMVRDLGSGNPIHPSDVANNWYYHGGGGPYYTGMNSVQVGVAFEKMRAEGIIDPSDFIDRNRPPSSTGVVSNGLFPFGALTDWSVQGPGLATVVEVVGAAWAWWVQMTAQSPVALSQVISVPDGPFSLSFEQQFLTTSGTLDVLLDSVVLASIDAPATLSDEPATFQLTVNDTTLFGLEDAILAFRFDGPPGSQVLLSDILLAATGNRRPVIADLAVDAELVTRPAELTLSAAGVSDMDGRVVAVEFYRVEALLGVGVDGGDAWTWIGSTADWDLGEHEIFARAEDNEGAYSEWVSTTVTIAKLPPSLTTVNPLMGAAADEPFSISYEVLAAASDASHPDGEPISFRVETVTSGELTMNGEPVIPGETLLSAEELWVWTPDGGASGVVEAFIVVAWDGEMASSPAVALEIYSIKGFAISKFS